MDSAIKALEQEGRVWFRNALADSDLAAFEATAEPAARPGTRLDNTTAFARALEEGALQETLSVVSLTHRIVRIVSFSKTRNNNWAVPWHQDRVIAVKDRVKTAGFRNWSQKSSVWHCEPPIDLLSRMIFIRVHLDDTDETNGAMQIALGSHKRGLVSAAEAEDAANAFPHETCTAKRGDIQVLKMLTLHRSRPSLTDAPRRVFRIDYADEDLPPPLEWAGQG